MQHAFGPMAAQAVNGRQTLKGSVSIWEGTETVPKLAGETPALRSAWRARNYSRLLRRRCHRCEPGTARAPGCDEMLTDF